MIFSKVFSKMLAVVAAVVAMSGFASMANAGCIGPCLSDMTSFTIGGGAGFEGIGNGVYDGGTGSVDIDQDGGSGINIGINAAGDNCEVNCGNVDWQFEGFAFQESQVKANASGNQMGTPVQVFTEGSSAGVLNFQFKNIGTSQ